MIKPEGELYADLKLHAKIESSKTVAEIQEILAKHGALKIMIEYDNAVPSALSFQMDMPYGLQSVRCPANGEGAMIAMRNDKIKDDKAQGMRVARRITKNWVEAQIALIETKQAELSQVFVPYIVNQDNLTVYELFQ